MSKINATYSSGYYIRPDMDIRKIEELKNKEKRETLKRQRDERAHEKKRKDLTMEELKEKRDDLIENIISGKHTKREARQTFAIPFDLFCTQCHRRIARQTHVYTDRYASPFPDPALRPTLTPEDQHLLFHTHKIRNVFLKIKCQYCDGLFLLETDNLTQKITGGYYCVKNCERPAGDVALLNNKRQHEENERQKQEKIEKEENVLDSLENENEKQRKRKLLEEEIKKSVEEQNNQHYYYTDVQKSALQLEALRKDENRKT
ncbi:hypothetical protein AGDE_17088 [Angomonas deanei]|uniref:Uncharacterized protein n=1 Tax=Angomonas deanei TaxID=59799 RepID=A0A7G2CFF1_9TRYP|nr:hypothetical protein AGDE_17088 [Angomonas deanei]CAD2218506.1 hypothetical protein, conserved [Angomonas deanei]|eukprot:EPY15519.1 hypothetical protein AGDE_17088 [Angomonas deanei]